MNQEQHGTGAAAAETLSEMESSAATTTNPVPEVAHSVLRERCQSQLAQIDHNLGTVDESIADLEAKIESSAMDKREPLRGKLRAFRQRREDLLADRALVERQLASIARQEQEGRVEDTARVRQQLQKDGAEVADKLRQGLVVVEGLFVEWLELKNRERVTKDILRSLAPERMSDLPEFSFTCAVDGNFEVALGQAIRECHRSQSDLQRRHNAGTAS
jgi:hypothetical protein